MFYLLLAMNAWTDFREGCIYDALSIALFLAAVLESGFAFNHGYFWECLVLLVLLFVWDREERYLGRGDYLILLAVSLYTGTAWIWVLLFSSLMGLLYLAWKRQPALPLVPFLLLGSILTRITGL